MIGATILNTTDGGLIWNKQTSPVDTVEFRKIKMIDNNYGYIITNKGSLLKTEDGGNNWTHIIINPYYPERPTLNIYKMPGAKKRSA